MTKNNNEKAPQPGAIERLFKLPVVRSACAKLCALYSETKRSSPTISSAFDVLESRATAWSTAACYRVSPIIIKLEPQVSFANNVACKSLDWLETSFPLLLSPTEQVLASVENNIHRLQDVVSVAVQHTVTWALVRMNQEGEQSPVKRAFSVAEEGLESTLSLLELWVDQTFPKAENEEFNKAHSLEGFEVVKVGGRYPERMISLSANLSQRTYQLVGSKILNPLPTPPVLLQDVLTHCLSLIWSLPQHLQHQALITIYFIIHTCGFRYRLSKRELASQGLRRMNAMKDSSVQVDVDNLMGYFTATARVRSSREFRFNKISNTKKSECK